MEISDTEAPGADHQLQNGSAESVHDLLDGESLGSIAGSVQQPRSASILSGEQVSDHTRTDRGSHVLDRTNDQSPVNDCDESHDSESVTRKSPEPELTFDDPKTNDQSPVIIDLTLDDSEDETKPKWPTAPPHPHIPKKEDDSGKHDIFTIPSFDEVLQSTQQDEEEGSIPDKGQPLDGNQGAILSIDQHLQDSEQFLATLLQDYTANTQANHPREKVQTSPSPNRQDFDHDDPAVDSDEEDRCAGLLFEDLRKEYEEKQARDELTTDDKVHFLRAEAEEQQRLNLRKRRKDFDNQQIQQEAAENNTLFLPETQVDPDDDVSMSMDAFMDHTEEGLRSPSPIEISDDEGEAKPKKGRAKGKNAKTALKSVTGKSRVSKPANNGKAGKRGRPKKGKNDLDMSGIRNLFHNDIIGQAQANQKEAAQPVLGDGKNKQKALLALIASLPVEEQDLNKGDQAKLLKASTLFSRRGVMKADGDKGWKLKGMKSSLHHFQMLGASWMREREMKGKPNGGILGDTMGFGKTVISLANIIDGKPPETWRGPKATLIVAPSNLLSQWLTEIAKHVEKTTFEGIIVYRAGSRLISANPSKTFGDQDIVITSYNEVLRSMPRNEPPSSLVTAQAKEEWWQEHFQKHKGPLHQVSWYRIVLDEAQAIKNYKSMTSEAARALLGKFRWCLTATPIQNSLEEFYPYMHFLREEHAGKGSFSLFKSNYCRLGSKKAIQRLQVTLNKIMLRRTHDAKLFNRPVLRLPPIAPVKTIEVKFNMVERLIYRIVRDRFMKKVQLINVGNENLAPHYRCMFVLLLRLRQLVGHPLLIQKSLQELLEREDIEKLWSLTKKHDFQNQAIDSSESIDGCQETVEALHTALLYAKNNQNSDASQTAEADNEVSINFRKYLQSLHDDGQWAKANERSLCHACGNPPDQPHLTPCMHLYCLGCLNDLWFVELNQGNNRATCMECGTNFDRADAFRPKAFGEASRTGNTMNRKPSDATDENIDWFDVPGPILRSAKVKGAIKQLNDWFKQDKTNKIIIFVQFRGLIKIMERVLREENHKSVTFDGSMSFDARDEAIRLFSAADSKYPILIAAMKAGGIGLNLTAANRVMILDLWWNELTESQAFCRAYRIGQLRDVEVVRFVVKNTIDTDILKMQERKTREIDKAMQEKNRPKLSVSELVDLFTDQVEDNYAEQHPNDLPFVFPDDPYQNKEADVDEDGNEIEMIGTN